MKFKPLFLEFLCAVIVAAFFMVRGCQHRQEAVKWKELAESGQIKWQSDSERLKKERNKLDQEIATTTALYNTNLQDLQAVKAELGSTMQALQREVRKNTQLAAIIRTQTSGEVIVQTDTVIINHSDSMPVYQTTYSDKWSRFEIEASPDTFLIDYTVYNEFAFQAEWKRPGLFKPKYLEASVKSLNPHSETVGLSTWVAPRQKPKRLAWFGVGVGIGLLVPIFLSK